MTVRPIAWYTGCTLAIGFARMAPVAEGYQRGEMMQGNRRLHLDTPARYRIEVQGRLDESWSSSFDNMTIAVENDDAGVAITTLSGTVADQVALHGLLARIRDLGLPLLRVQCVERGQFFEEVDAL